MSEQQWPDEVRLRPGFRRRGRLILLTPKRYEQLLAAEAQLAEERARREALVAAMQQAYSALARRGGFSDSRSKLQCGDEAFEILRRALLSPEAPTGREGED